MRKTQLFIPMVIAACMTLFSCAYHDDMPDAPGDWTTGGDGYGGEGGSSTGSDSGEGSANGNTSAGQLTAGEWSDLDNWTFWADLVNGQVYGEMQSYWGYFTDGRVAVRLHDASQAPCVGMPVELLNAQDEVLWQGVTDNHGEVNLYPSLFAQSATIDSTQTIRFGSTTATAQVTFFGDSTLRWNEYECASPSVAGTDILFIVDATGSMGDEIDFLQDDLQDILKKTNVPNLHTGALFYRDEGDDYLTRVSDMNEDMSTTIQFIGKQSAEGGGDYPEAVHIALAAALQQVSWRENARVKLAFMLLDAPPHYRSDVIESLHRSSLLLAKNGIRIIPIAASGVDKQTEFFLRFLALTTEGTYTFLTNDSGIGGDHIAASVGDYQVELLNDLVIRLIREYTE